MMIGISFSMLEHQRDLVLEEKRKIRQLNDKLQSLYQAGLILDNGTYQRLNADLDRLSRSVSYRESWLETVRESFIRLHQDNLDRFNQEEEIVGRLLS